MCHELMTHPLFLGVINEKSKIPCAVLRHAARHAQRGGKSGQDRYYYLKYSFPSFFLHTQFFLVINDY